MKAHVKIALIVSSLAVSFALIAGSASAETPTLPGPMFPGWLSVPSANDMARAAPGRAASEGVSGTTILFCKVREDGRLEACKVESEVPAGWGFGDASLSLVGKFQMKPQKRDGTPVAGETVKFPIRFVAP